MLSTTLLALVPHEVGRWSSTPYVRSRRASRCMAATDPRRRRACQTAAGCGRPDAAGFARRASSPPMPRRLSRAHDAYVRGRATRCLTRFRRRRSPSPRPGGGRGDREAAPVPASMDAHRLEVACPWCRLPPDEPLGWRHRRRRGAHVACDARPSAAGLATRSNSGPPIGLAGIGHCVPQRSRPGCGGLRSATFRTGIGNHPRLIPPCEAENVLAGRRCGRERGGCHRPTTWVHGPRRRRQRSPRAGGAKA